VARTAITVVGLAIAATMWSPRPLMIGLVLLGLTLLVAERRLPAWILLPVFWVWVNSHGSFPLGIVWLVARAGGEWLDWKAWPRETLRYAWTFVGSLAVAAVNPLGAKLLLFPLTLGKKQSTFESIIEWQSPNFHLSVNRFALVFLLLAALLLFRARLTWRDVVPTVVFLGAGLYAVRNLPLLAIVVAPVMCRIFRKPEWTAPRPAPTASQLRMNRALGVTIAAAFVVFGVAAANTEALTFKGYPVKAVDYLQDNQLLGGFHLLAHQDVVGNYLTLRYGRTVPVFIDDRVDMYPTRVTKDYISLLRGRPDTLDLLNNYGIDVVLWDRQQPLIQIIAASGKWHEVFRDHDWVVYRRT